MEENMTNANEQGQTTATNVPNGTAANVPADAATGAEQEGKKEFTQEEVNKLISDRIRRESEKWGKELERKLTEAERLAKMTAEEKAEHERKQAEAALAKREADITRRELKAEAKDTLAGKGLPVELAEILNYEDAEACSASLSAVEKAFVRAVEQQVNDRLRSAPPKTGGGQPTLTKEQFQKMSYMERVKVKTEQPELYNQLMGGNK